MILKEYRKTGLIVSVIAIVLIFIITRNINLVGCFLLGYLVSNINLYINSYFLDISGTKNAVIRNLINYFVRIALYAIVLVIGFKWMATEGIIFAFFGCLNIRVSILIFTVKEVILDGNN
jgi:hypothetical protein